MQITSRGITQSGIGYRWYLHLANGRQFGGWCETMEGAIADLEALEFELGLVNEYESPNPLNELLP